MATTVTLQSIRDAVNEKFGSLFIPLGDEAGTVVELLPAMRLGEKARAALSAIEPDKDENGEVLADFDVVEIYRKWVRVVARTEEQAEKLIELAGDTIGMWKEIQDNWNEKTQPGEASPSRV